MIRYFCQRFDGARAAARRAQPARYARDAAADTCAQRDSHVLFVFFFFFLFMLYER